ncbi:MAG: HAMP domain-containing protein [Deltaproteobacteria bacterium]|nr:HAMP domain-containing protein [Deltaproteobacteria bacterium]
MKKTFFPKLFGGFIIIIITFSVSLSALSFKMIRRHYVDAMTSDLQAVALTLAETVEVDLIADSYDSLQRFITKTGESLGFRITVIDSKGSVITDSESSAEMMESHVNRPEIIEALQGTIGVSQRFSTTVKKDVLYVAVPIFHNEKIVGTVRTSMLLDEIEVLLGALKTALLQVLAVSIFVSLAIAFLLTRKLSRPLRELRDASKMLSEGDFNARVYLRNDDEFRELGDCFNSMGGQIQSLFKELSRQKEHLSGMIAAVREGFIALDGQGKITLANESFRRMAGKDGLVGRFYWEIIREPNFKNLMETLHGGKQDICNSEVELKGRTYMCSGSVIPSYEETVIVFHDITEVKSLDKIKKDFIVNVSHELRTPLTAIKGFAETLEELIGDDENRQYVEIIKRNTDRLINIVKDLLLLSELEERGTRLIIEDIDVKDMIESTMTLFKGKAAEGGLDLTAVIGNDVPTIRGDRFKLEQVIINLLDNAIKYSEQGCVGINVARKGAMVEIAVSDTGIGIPEQEQKRIFERFYVVDKSRSRRSGGTGLGLAIVKYIVLLHGGKVEVRSALGEGTTFTVFLPQVMGEQEKRV